MPSTARRRPLLVLALAVAGIAAAATRVPALPARPPAFEALRAASGATAESARPAILPEGPLDLAAGADSAHASSLAALPDGRVLVAWFAGSREGASDVAIRMALLRAGRVEREWESLSRTGLQSLVHRAVRKLGNPVLSVRPDGTLDMFVVSVGIGGWSGSAVNHLQSDDLGRTWRTARRLVLSPFLNLGTLVRTPPLALSDGSMVLPAYHEFIRKWGMAARLAPDGTVLGVARMPSDGPLLQPAAAATSAQDAVAVLRSGNRAEPRVHLSRTTDLGRTWSEAVPTEIPNPDSAVALVRLADGRLLLAANPVERGRHELALFVRDASGGEWVRVRTVESGDPATDEFSYPALCAQPDGSAWLSYTLRRRGIRVRAFAAGALSVAAGTERAP